MPRGTERIRDAMQSIYAPSITSDLSALRVDAIAAKCVGRGLSPDGAIRAARKLAIHWNGTQAGIESIARFWNDRAPQPRGAPRRAHGVRHPINRRAQFVQNLKELPALIDREKATISRLETQLRTAQHRNRLEGEIARHREHLNELERALGIARRFGIVRRAAGWLRNVFGS